MRTKKIAFIHPQVGFKPYSALGTYPLGILSLATTLKKARPEDEVWCFDENSKPVFKNGEITEKFLLEADVVGISGLTSTAPRAYELADRLRDMRTKGKTNPNLQVIMGGMHATALPNEAINHADCVVRGEAENNIVNLIESRTQGIIKGERIADLDSLVDPDYSLMHFKRKRFTDILYGDLASLQTSRGCSFNCDFCSVWSTFGPPRSESYGKTYNKIYNLVEQSFRRGFLHDDNSSENKENRVKLYDLLIMARLGFNYITQDRIDLLQDEDYVKKMAMSGCTMVMFSLESPNEEFLKMHNKELDLGKVERGVSLLRKNKIVPYAFCMIEPDNPEMTKHTIELLRELRIKYAQFTIPTPLPGSVLYQKAKDRIQMGWEYFTGLSLVTENREKAREAGKHLSEAWKEFYSPIRATADIFKLKLSRAFLRYYGYRVGRQIMNIQP